MNPDTSVTPGQAPTSTYTPPDPLKFPQPADKARLNAYKHYDQLYFGDHYAAFSAKVDSPKWNETYKQLRFITANFAGLCSRVMADMLFGEKFTWDVPTDANQKWIDDFMEDNQVKAQFYESALSNSRRGDDLFKLRIGQRNPSDITSDVEVILEQIPASIYFPTLSVTGTRNTPSQDVLIWQFQQDNNWYIHKEIHTPGHILHEIYSYDPNQELIISKQDVVAFGFKEIEDTGIDRSLVFHIPNVRDGSGFWGTSDYKDLESLFFALDNRMTKVDNILDKHSDPILAVPPGVIDEKGKVKRSALNMFEVNNDNPGFNKPEYIVWNANLDAAFTEIDKLVEMLYLFSEVAPASTGVSDSGGQAESGRALKFKLLSTIRKRNRKLVYYDQAIRDIVETAQEFAIANNVDMSENRITAAERPDFDWGEGVINDQTEMIADETARVEAGLQTKVAAIAKLDGTTPDAAKQKLKDIEAEQTSPLPPPDAGSGGKGAAPPVNDPGIGNNGNTGSTGKTDPAPPPAKGS